MISGIIITCIAAVLWFFTLRYSLSMFQQNSNRLERYLRWAKGKVFRPVFAPPSKAKVKFVFTARMKRLAFTATVLFVLAAVLSPYAAAALAVFCDVAVILAVIVNTPVEKLIIRRYINDARRILRSHDNLVVIGVTGSFGKTSTKNYLYRVLSAKYNTLVTPGNYNTLLGVVRTIREQLQPYHEVFIVEMGAKQTGDIKEICDLVHPVMGIITAVGPMHLETFRTIGNIQSTKFELARALPSDGLAVINVDSPLIASYDGIPTHCKVVGYGTKAASGVQYLSSDISYSPAGMEFTASGAGQQTTFRTKLLGRSNILNLLGAIAVADALGIPRRDQQIAVSKLESVEHRLSMRHNGAYLVIDDAYNSNPEGARMALEVLSTVTLAEGGKRIAVTPGFVEMGARQYEENRTLGLEASKSCDILIVVNKLNREAICAGAEEGGMGEGSLYCADSLGEASIILSKVAPAGSCVLYENDLPDLFK